ncbi:STE20-related kinase adapter protein alpha isoform X2 [Octopus bimaculoides]|uniref:STE20-related kinase adapter protein alpha isoform X2 n=1 Tax=Octopus bimaculoides TaxID=37653 RepID=UPI00071E4803|nr:STE20-related kinase adapter protein alpha isoform X2 [Octopus bimaculoides]|eukprot:XP_014783091.1 PREDICTED: STE20-related kinase adapter protein alpha-like isoform X2 [Octopus bimaculoides]
MSNSKEESHCACTKARVGDSPVSAPFDRDLQYPSNENQLEASPENNAEMVKYEPNWSHYTLYSLIGHGFCDAVTVYLAKHRPSGTNVAIKKIDLENVFTDIADLQKEIALVQQLQHDKILKFHTTFVYDHELWIVMPFMAYGSCKDIFHAYFTSGLPEQAIAYILRDTIKSLEYLHSRGIIHRAVKASHVLISASGNVQLSGLHNALSMIQSGKRLRRLHDYPASAINILLWLSPEILEQNMAGYDTRSDIYSIGILACELANGYAPFADMPVTQMLLAKLNGTKPVLLDSRTINEFGGVHSTLSNRLSTNIAKDSPAYTRTFSYAFHNFVDMCLEKEAHMRLPLSSLLNHAFLKNLRKNTADVLPGLLHPVTPLTDISKLPKQDVSEMDELIDATEDISIEDKWIF